MTAQSITRPRKLKKTKSDTVRELIENGCHSVTTIAKAVDCNHAMVSRILATYNLEENQVESYKANRAKILAGYQAKILKGITLDDVKKASLLQKVTSASILFDKERLELGQATSLIGHGVGLSAPLQEAVDKLIGRAKPVDNSQIVDVNEINPLNNVVKSVT